MTQADLDKLIAREKDKAKRAALAEADEAAHKASLTDLEKAQAEKAEAEAKAAAREAAADHKLITAAAKLAAASANVDPKRVDVFMRLVDLDGIEVGDDGEPDTKAIDAAVASAIKIAPEFAKPAAGPGASGGEFGKPTDRQRPKGLAAAVEGRLAG